MGHQPHRRSSEIPSLRPAIVAMTINSSLGVLNTLAFLDPGGLPWFVSATCAAMSWGATWLSKRFYNQIVAKRKEWRKQHYEEWLFEREFAPAGDQVDWAEIERAMDILLKQGIDPTYERARDLLRKENEMAEQRKRHCPHSDLEILDTFGGGSKHICLECGQVVSDAERMNHRPNPFRPPLDRSSDEALLREALLIEQKERLTRAFSVPPQYMILPDR